MDRPNKMVDGKIVPLTDVEWAAYQALQNAPPAPVAYDISKAELWRRTTEDEAEALRAALSQSSARLQGIFEGATVLRTDDPDFPTMRAGIVAAVGEARANVLLAPTS